jgi:hypothetical protein
MKINALRKLCQDYDLKTLKQLEEELVEEKPLSLEVEGEDEGEQLTHIMGAIWILEQANDNGTDVKTELRNFSNRVRNSIN